MPTTNPVPSQDPSDLLFNAAKLDEVLNGTGNSFTDRLGVARRTVAGMNADFDAQLADAESDLNVYRSDAAASAAEALGYLQTIRTTSYGAYASDPATDPLGNPPTVGDEYFNTTANLLKRWNGTTWQASDINTANLAAPGGSSLVGFQPPGAGAAATTVQSKLSEFVSVKDKGAKGDFNGSTGTDDSAAFVAAGSNFLVPSTGNFLIAQSISVGNMLCLGGKITVPAGVTLTIESVDADLSSVIFYGAGTVKTRNSKYSIPWFAGNSLNEKWDFCSRGFADAFTKHVILPDVKDNDPAASVTHYNKPAWGVTAPIYFSNKHNALVFESYGRIVPKQAMASPMVIFSEDSKTEDITFTNGLNVEGRYLVDTGIEIRGGARLCFNNWTRARYCNGNAIEWNTKTEASDEITFQNLEVSGYGGVGLAVHSENINVNCKIENLFTNGSGYALGASINGVVTTNSVSGTNVVSIKGHTKGLHIERLFENLGTLGFTQITDCFIRVTSENVGSTAEGQFNPGQTCLTVGEFASTATAATAKPVLITSVTTGSRKIPVEIESIKTYRVAAGIVQLAHAKNCKIGAIRGSEASVASPETAFIQIGANCENIDVTDNDLITVSGYCDGLRQGGKTVLPKTTLATDTALSIRLPHQGNVPVDIIGSGSTVWASFISRYGSSTGLLGKGSAVTLTTGPLTGTTGTSGTVTVSVHTVSNTDRRLYIENRIASSQDFIVYCG